MTKADRPLWARESEKMILGRCLLEHSAAPLEGLGPTTDFYNRSNQEIARAIQALARQEIAIDEGSVVQWLEDQDRHVEASYVSGLPDGVAMGTPLEYHRERMRQMTRWRGIQHDVQAVQQATQNGRNLADVRTLIEHMQDLAQPPRQAPSDANPNSIRLVLPAGTATSTVTAWLGPDFYQRKLPAKEPLVEGILFRRDIIGFIGRRRDGKTSLALNLGLRLAGGTSQFLGYQVPCPKRVLMIYLEDDPAEIQNRLHEMTGGCLDERLIIQTREDFDKLMIRVDERSNAFMEAVRRICDCAKPDLIVIDNVAHCLAGDFNNPKAVHSLVIFARDLTQTYNAAVMMPAHPRKRSQEAKSLPVKLRRDPHLFFEEVLGSSHFINNCGSLWGIERNRETETSDFVAGSQRVTGDDSVAVLRMDDAKWFHVLDDKEQNLELLLKTDKRRAAWARLPEHFTFDEGVQSSGLSRGGFSNLKREAQRLGLLVADLTGWRKV
jgi:hypothetical protein